MTVEVGPGSTRIAVRGELDPHNSRYLEVLGFELLEGGEVPVLVVECSGVTHAGSHGLGAMVELARCAADHGARLEVESPSPVVQRLLDLAGLGCLHASGRSGTGESTDEMVA